MPLPYRVVVRVGRPGEGPSPGGPPGTPRRATRPHRRAKGGARVDIPRLAVAEPFGRDKLHSSQQDPDAQAQIGKIHAARREWNPAIEYLQTAHSLDPSRKDILHRLADAQIGAGITRKLPKSCNKPSMQILSILGHSGSWQKCMLWGGIYLRQL